MTNRWLLIIVEWQFHKQHRILTQLRTVAGPRLARGQRVFGLKNDKKEIGWLNRQKESVIRRGDGHSPMEVGDL